MSAAPPTLRFVTRVRCPLCDAGRERVDRWAGRLGFAVTDVDVDSDAALADRYGARVPVLLAGEAVVAEGGMPVRGLVAGLLRLRLDTAGRRGGAARGGN